MKGTKRFRNKSFNKGDCIQTVSDKRLQHGPPKGYREKALICQEAVLLIIIRQNRNCL